MKLTTLSQDELVMILGQYADDAFTEYSTALIKYGNLTAANIPNPATFFAAVTAWQTAKMNSETITFTEVEKPKAETRLNAGVYDMHGQLLFLGDRVRYVNQGTHTKQEYWNPEYEIIWDPPCFSLKHIGGGQDGGDHAFILKYGGSNGDLEFLSRP